MSAEVTPEEMSEYRKLKKEFNLKEAKLIISPSGGTHYEWEDFVHDPIIAKSIYVRGSDFAIAAKKVADVEKRLKKLHPIDRLLLFLFR